MMAPRSRAREPEDGEYCVESPLRTLARSLLREALFGSAYAPPPSRQAPPRAGTLRWTQETMITALHTFMQRTGRLPTEKEWGQPTPHGLPGKWAVRRHWGSRLALVRAVRKAEHDR